MEENEKDYAIYNGSKLEYSETEDGEYTKIPGLKTIPDFGGEPNTIDTTDLENTEYETSMLGLKPSQNFTFEFNMESPSVTSNIKIASDLEDSKKSYYWKLTYTNGIIIKFQSKVRTTILGGSSQDLIGFQMHLTPRKEPVKDIPVKAEL